MNPRHLTYGLVLRLWPLGRTLNHLANVSLLARWLQPFFRTEDHEAIIVPIQEAVRGSESVVLPAHLIPLLVERASSRALLHECLCRRGEGCTTYPHQPGCLILGEAAAMIDPTRGRVVTVDEALAHARQAVSRGLVPLVVHAAFDAWLLDIPYRRMLAICFCCDCCCAVRHGLRLGPAAFWETVVRLLGLDIVVETGCSGCGQCLEVCHVGAISMENGRATIAQICKGCGRCVACCPEGAIRFRIQDEQNLSLALLARVEARTDIGFRACASAPE